MGALRLETFIPLPPAAEDEGLVGPQDLAAAREAAYAEGVKAGAAAATSAFEAEKTRLLSPILEAVQDAILTRAEARAGALNGLRPLLDMLSTAVLPPLSFHGLIAEITESIASAAETAPEDQLILRLAPDNVEPIRAALGPSAAGLQIAPDVSLGPMAARLHWGGGFDAIDMARVLNEAQALCARFFAAPDVAAERNTTPKTETPPSQGDANVG